MHIPNLHVHVQPCDYLKIYVGEGKRGGRGTPLLACRKRTRIVGEVSHEDLRYDKSMSQ